MQGDSIRHFLRLYSEVIRKTLFKYAQTEPAKLMETLQGYLPV